MQEAGSRKDVEEKFTVLSTVYALQDCLQMGPIVRLSSILMRVIRHGIVGNLPIPTASTTSSIFCLEVGTSPTASSSAA